MAGIGKSLPLITRPPESRRVLMTYAENVLMTESAVGLGVSYFWRLNSVFDPNASGAGGVCVGYNTWSALFLNYRVNRVTVRMTMGCHGGTLASATGFCTLAPVARQAVVPSNASTWRMLPQAQSKLVAPIGAGGHNLAEFTATYDLPKLLRITPNQYMSDMDFSGAVGSNPAREAYLLTGFQGIGVSSVMTAVFTVSLTYEVEWFNPVPIQ